MSYFNIIKLDATPSTNDYLKHKHKKGQASDGDLVWAKDQTSGRGQRENKWESDSENSLTFSIYKDFKGIRVPSPFLISAVISLGIIEALEALQIPNLAIKWPNDILSGDQKIGGILIENFFYSGKLKTAVIGIGLNISQEAFDYAPFAASLKQVSGKFFKVNQVLEVLLPFLENALYTTDFIESKRLLDRYQSKLWKRNKTTSFLEAGEIIAATPLGVTLEGKLILELKENQIVEKDTQQIRMCYETKQV